MRNDDREIIGRIPNFLRAEQDGWGWEWGRSLVQLDERVGEVSSCWRVTGSVHPSLQTDPVCEGGVGGGTGTGVGNGWLGEGVGVDLD